MQRTKIECQLCSRLISKSNIKAHQRACLNLKDDDSSRIFEAQKLGGLKKAVNAKDASNKRVNDKEYPFELLTSTEQRLRIKIEQTNLCAVCAIPEVWNNKPLKFDLDHIDGNRSNNSRCNLRLICPNCHSQTSTYKVGNNKQPGGVTYTDEQIIEALRGNESAYQAMKSIGMNPHGGNYTRLRRLVKKYQLVLPYSF